jgi:hypothetical protein
MNKPLECGLRHDIICLVLDGDGDATEVLLESRRLELWDPMTTEIKTSAASGSLAVN